MKKNTLLLLTTLTACTIFIGLNGCSQKKPKADDAGIISALDNSGMGTSDEGKALGLKTVFFEYDTPLLSQEAKKILKHNSEILKTNTNVKVQVEGNCDERGGEQYNLALGEKRANSVKLYLQDLGITDSRITTVSFGKERPLVTGETEESFAKNRRTNFAITAK